jgi:hypothetical protein
MSHAMSRAKWMRATVRLFLPGAVLLTPALTGCDRLLDVTSNTHTVDASTVFGLREAMVGATANLYRSYDVKIVHGGLLSDEFANSGTSPGIQEVDRRILRSAGGGGAGRGSSISNGFYTPLQRAAAAADLLQERILSGGFSEITGEPADAAEYAQASLYSGLAKTWIADLYCTMAFGGTGPELTTEDGYRIAEQEFTEAIDAANAAPDIHQAALVGRARVRLILGDDAGALADAQEVDPSFELQATYSSNTFEQRNMVHFRTWDFGNWTVGPDFRDLTIDATGTPDPRVALEKNPHAAWDPSQDLYTPLKVPSPSSPLTIASGDEAQLIIAEIVGGSEAVQIINDVRARNGVTTTWSPTGGANEIRDKVIDERKRTLFLEGVRLGDIRRYIDKFGLDFFPTSTPQGFQMGDQTCYPMPDIERNNNPGL